MVSGQNTLWDSLFKPVANLFINWDEVRQIKDSIDWERMTAHFRQPNLIYPEYYRSTNFHGIQGGYLSVDAATTYDPITQCILLPNETWIRQGVIDAIGGKPRRILDLGCGTGSTTLLLKKAFPEAEVIGIDLSPYMLAMADYKGKQAGLKIEWQQRNAQKTDFPADSFEVVTASLLFHETPPSVAISILREAFRLLVPGGDMIVLDGNQKVLRQTQWLTEIFEEPYLKEYEQESLEAWMGAAHFQQVQSQELWLIHQMTKGIKPLNLNMIYSSFETIEVIDAIPVV